MANYLDYLYISILVGIEKQFHETLLMRSSKLKLFLK